MAFFIYLGCYACLSQAAVNKVLSCCFQAVCCPGGAAQDCGNSWAVCSLLILEWQIQELSSSCLTYAFRPQEGESTSTEIHSLLDEDMVSFRAWEIPLMCSAGFN